MIDDHGSRVAEVWQILVTGVSLADIAPAALQQHFTWGVQLAALALYGSGKWSLDAWLQGRWLASGSEAGGRA